MVAVTGAGYEQLRRPSIGWEAGRRTTPEQLRSAALNYAIRPKMWPRFNCGARCG